MKVPFSELRSLDNDTVTLRNFDVVSEGTLPQDEVEIQGEKLLAGHLVNINGTHVQVKKMKLLITNLPNIALYSYLLAIFAIVIWYMQFRT